MQRVRPLTIHFSYLHGYIYPFQSLIIPIIEDCAHAYTSDDDD